MEPTTGLILRRITQTNLSVAAHKLATLILDAIAWKDGYNGLSRGTAAFTLSALAEKMGVSRQYLSVLLSELETSELQLERAKPNGKFAPWIFRFSAFDEESETHDLVPGEGDTSLSRDNNNKTIFSGLIEITESSNVFQSSWAEHIKSAKATLACWNVHPGHLGPLLRVQSVPRQREGAGRLPAWLHAPMAKFVGNSNSSRGQAAREINNGPQRARIAETDASRTNCEPPVPRVRLVSLDRTRCLRSACIRCDLRIWVPEIFSDLGGARTSGVDRGDFQVGSLGRRWRRGNPAL